MSVLHIPAVWKDETSYSRGDTKREPRVWSIRSGHIQLSIVFGHIYYPEQWVVHCAALGIDTYPLKATKKEPAQSAAIEYAKEKMEILNADFQRLVVQA